MGRQSFVVTSGLCLIAASAALPSGPASAQSAPAAADAEIVVTAQRREAAISDVPIAMSAFSGDALKDRNVVELRDVAEQISGVQVFRLTSGAPNWIIRGVGLVEFNANNPPPASNYLDEVYQVTAGLGSLPLFDVGRVEVLKGPQGGAYGRNTTGGAVRIFSREPDLKTVTANATASFDNHERTRIEGGVSAPIVEDQFALRIAAMTETGGAWQRSLTDDQEWGDADKLAMRATALLEPNATTRLKLIVDSVSDESQVPMLRAIGARATPAEGGQTANLWCPAIQAGQLSDACRTYPGVLAGLGFSFLTNELPSLQAKDGSTTLSNAYGAVDMETLGVTFDARFDFGFADFISITGYRDYDYARSADLDATGAETGHTVTEALFDIFSQEVRLQSNGDRALTWAVGLAYGEETLKDSRTFFFRDDPFSFSGFAAYGAASRAEAIAIARFDQETTTSSAYLELGYTFSPKWSLQGALRYTDLEKSYTNGGFVFPIGTGPISTNPAVQRNVNFQLAESYDLDEHFSGNVYLSYRPIDDMLVYTSIGRGVKEGGFFGGFPGQGQDSIVPFLEEVMTAYELGVKSSWLENTLQLNAAAFYYDYADAQTNVPAVSATGAVFGRPGNVDAQHEGIELEARWRPVTPLMLEASVTALNAEFTESVEYATQDFPGGRANYDGLQREYAPDLSWFLRASYDFTLGSAGLLTVAVDANGRSDRFEPKPSENRTTRREVALRTLEEYTLVNGRVTYSSPNDRYSVSAFGRNLTEEEYILATFGDGIAPSYGHLFGEPLTYGLEVSVRY